MNKVDDGKTAVKIGNPKTLEFQVVRTSLIPGLLKTIRENRSHPLPIKVFESTDIVLKDPRLERQARNVRHAAAVWCNKSAGFEVIHGLLDKVMKTLEVKRINSSDTKSESGYYLKEKDGESDLRLLQRLLWETHHSPSQIPPTSPAVQPQYTTALHHHPGDVPVKQPSRRASNTPWVFAPTSNSVASVSYTPRFSRSSRFHIPVPLWRSPLSHSSRVPILDPRRQC